MSQNIINSLQVSFIYCACIVYYLHRLLHVSFIICIIYCACIVYYLYLCII